MSLVYKERRGVGYAAARNLIIYILQRCALVKKEILNFGVLDACLQCFSFKLFLSRRVYSGRNIIYILVEM